MTNFNDTSGTRIEDLSIPARAYSLLEELAVVKNRTVQELIEDYILAGLHCDIHNHQALGMQYANYLGKAPVRFSRTMEGLEKERAIMATKIIQFGANKPLRISLPDCYSDVLFAMAALEGRTVEELAIERLKQIIIEDAVQDTEHIGELISNGWKEILKDDKYYNEIAAGR